MIAPLMVSYEVPDSTDGSLEYQYLWQMQALKNKLLV